MNSSSMTNEPEQIKKPYTAPQLIEHGTIEDITGFVEDFSGSGPQQDIK